jgi:hypothetical protein
MYTPISLGWSSTKRQLNFGEVDVSEKEFIIVRFAVCCVVRAWL